ncbi:hypothetical protein IHE44_0009836, partial [Lamprotornis superbus]
MAMASKQDTQKGDAKAQLLAEAFQKEGLDDGYWLPKMSQILGIKCREALQHLEYEDYLKLECEVQHPWEKKALLKLLKIDDETCEGLQEHKLEKEKQRQKVAKQALKDLTEMLNRRSHSQDELKKKAETLWQAMEIPKEDHGAQLQFLQDISAVNVALVSELEHMDNRGKQLLQDLWQSQRPLICLLTEKENIATGKSSKKIKIGIKNRNEAELINQLIKIIRDFLEGSNPCFSLDACADKARQHGFVVDADQPACVTAKAKAKELVDLLKKEKLSEIKSQLLPLQGKLWYQWCKKDKEFTRLQEKGNKSIEHHRSQIEDEKKAIRRKQLDQAFPLNLLMKSFLGFLQVQPADTKKYFLQWMKVFMDELSCGHLEELRRDYHNLWTEILSGKKNEEKNNVNSIMYSKLEAVSDEIKDSSIGLEHLLREVGQIYEALEFMNSKEDKFAKLPEIAAELMVSGYPVELMDGDASYLPLRWVGAVFDSLIERLGDKRVFVLSVLGIQSTGKSTLLNAMFGLQFNVSAGRCTRGAFMQLIPVGKELQQDLGFDFVLIQPALCKAVFERTAKDIAEDMQGKFPDFRGNRANLEVCILRYLAEQENFEQLTEVINLPRSELKGIEHQEVTDIEFLSSAMAKPLAAMKDKVKEEFPGADLSSFSRQPHTILAEHFSGCWEQCPFCGAVCTNTIWNHDGDHQLVFHRPRALMGTTWEGTNHLVIDICSSLVTTNRKFRFDNSKWIPYKTYWDAGPPFSTWRILPDSSMQAYWKWFVSRFRTQLEDLYNGKFQDRGEIPGAWQRITKQEALSELDRTHPWEGRTM